MGYRIEYGQTVKRESINDISFFKNKKAGICTILIIAAFVILLFCISIESVRSYILPGNPLVTEQALNTFAEQVGAGAPFGEAAAAFCQEIVDGAQIS